MTEFSSVSHTYLLL